MILSLRSKKSVIQFCTLIAIFIITYSIATRSSSSNIVSFKSPTAEPAQDAQNAQSAASAATNTLETSDKKFEGLEVGKDVREGISDPFIANNLFSDNYKRVNATILTLCRNEDLEGVLETVRKLEDRFNHNYHYDWVFLNNVDFTAEFKEKVANFVSGKAKFGTIPEEYWSYPDFIDLEKAAKDRKEMQDKGVIYAGSESYRHMCRFNSGFFYKHPLMLDYKYYWRVEPHVDFWCDVTYDPFKYMVDNNKSYGFTISIHEFELTIKTLWETTKNFLKENPAYLHKNNFMKFLSEDGGEKYNLCHFWSNFEIADMDFWRSEPYEEYFKALDKTGGFFYERWGDAPVHSIAISLFEDKSKIHFFKDIAYTHSSYTMCPIEDSIYIKNKCSCDKKNDFTFEGYSCGKEYYDAMGLTKPSNWKDYA